MEVEGTRRIVTAVRAALRGIRATPLVFSVSVGTMAAGLLLLGTYLLVVQNMRAVLENFGHGLRLVAFLEEESATSLESIRTQLAGLSGVGSVRFVSKDEALERLRTDLGRDADVLDSLEGNPLPASLEIDVAAGSRGPVQLRALARKIRRLDGVSETRYGEDWVESYARIVYAVEWLGLGLGILLLLMLGTIMAGTVRLAVHSRNDEIEIQRLVGAGALFVRLPFYLEGALQGCVAAAATLALMYGLFHLGLPLLGELLVFLLGKPVPSFFGLLEVLILFVVGIGLGVGGAAVSLVRLEETS